MSIVPPPLVRERFAYVLPGQTEPLTFYEANRHEFCHECGQHTTELASTETGDRICEPCATHDATLTLLNQEPPC